MNKFLVLDVGTTGIKAFIFDDELSIIKEVYETIPLYTPCTGWVEQDPLEILDVSKQLIRRVLENEEDIVSMGIATQRETFLLWDKSTKTPLYQAIVWQDERTKELCASYSPSQREVVREKTGLPIIPYFTASKLQWLLDQDNFRERAEAGEIRCGTLDTWLLHMLTEEKSFLTDYTNASRTLLFNIHTDAWDDELMHIFNIPLQLLPQTVPSHYAYGSLAKEIAGFSIPIRAVAGDQQASLSAVGTSIGTTKVTIGTGIFIMQVVEASTSIPQGFFLTRTTDITHRYALEAKIGKGAERISPVLHDNVQLENVMDDIAHEITPYIEQLPYSPKEITADGGGAQNDFLIRRIHELSHIPIKRLHTHQGTALGVALLLKG